MTGRGRGLLPPLDESDQPQPTQPPITPQSRNDPRMSTDLDHDVYPMALRVDEIFADATYQRVLDVARARSMSTNWDRRLAGVIEVSDRGEHASPRYAIVDGQHRWAAAKNLRPAPVLVANVHEGLTPADEAALFDKLNRQRKQPTTWDHWRARRAANDQLVLAIEETALRHELRVHEQSGKDGVITCVSTLEKIANSVGGLDLLDAALNLIKQAWGEQRDAYDSPIVMGMAMVIQTFGADRRLNGPRLVEALAPTPARRIRFQASALRDSTPGSLAKLTAITLVNQYNRRPGPKLYFPQRWTGALPKARRTGGDRA